MYRECYLIREYCKNKENEREKARDDFKESVRTILEFEDSGIITTSEAIGLISKYADKYEEVNSEYVKALTDLNRLRTKLV